MYETLNGPPDKAGRLLYWLFGSERVLFHMNYPSELEPVDNIAVYLPSGTTVDLPRRRPVFQKWRGAHIAFSFGNKPALEHGSEAIFAELLILRLLVTCGWEGVWAEAFGGLNYLKTMPKAWNLAAEHVAILPEREALLSRILSNV